MGARTLPDGQNKARVGWLKPETLVGTYTLGFETTGKGGSDILKAVHHRLHMCQSLLLLE